MSQKLILPMNKAVFTAGYKNEEYLKQQGYKHYGVDMYGELGPNVYSCGNGTVFSCGLDSRFGNSIVIIYRDVELHDGTIRDFACRMYHLSKIHVIRGQKVKQGDLIGVSGNTGLAKVKGKPMGIHLHTEFDTDIQYPHFAYGILTSGTIIKRGTIDSTMNPSNIWHLGKDQTIKGRYAGWFERNDVDLPKV